MKKPLLLGDDRSSGIPLVERLKEKKERSCGVWVLNIETGQTLGFCKFEEGVQEIFAAEVLLNTRFPDLVTMPN